MLKDLIALIPAEETKLLQQLKSISSSMDYCPPEDMERWFTFTRRTLLNHKDKPWFDNSIFTILAIESKFESTLKG